MKLSVCMGTLWILCAEQHDTTPIGNHHQQQQQQPQHPCEEPQQDYPQQQQRDQQQEQLQQLLQARVAFERMRRRTKPLRDESGRWVCDVCGRAYSRGDSLAHHRSIHRGDTVCPICQVVFTRKYTMQCHMMNVHGVK